MCSTLASAFRFVAGSYYRTSASGSRSHARWQGGGAVMDPHVWLVFVAASAVMGLAPGPAVTSIVGYALSSGRTTALAAVAGVAVGNVIAMSLSLGGVGALLSASALA